MEERISSPERLAVAGFLVCGLSGGLLGLSIAYATSVPSSVTITLGSGIGGVMSYAGTLLLLRVPKPQKETSRQYTSETVRVPVIQADGMSGQYAHFPVGRDRLAILASGLTEGKKFTEAVWLGVFTRKEYTAIREEMIDRKWARWRSDISTQRGVEITPQGRAVMRYLSGQNPPLPTEDRYTLLHSTVQ